MSNPRRRLPAGKKLLFSAAVLVALLVAAEVACRVIGLGRKPPTAHYIADWDEQWQGDFYVLHPDPGNNINGDGVRDRDHAVDNPDGTRRVICLGDSVTFGYGPKIKFVDSYPAILQRLLDERGEDVEVFNVALPGWSTRQQRIAYEQIVQRYKPDHVILGFCLNDVAEMKNNLAPPPALLATLYEHSNLVRALLRPQAVEIHQVELLFDRPDAPGVRKGWELCFEEIRQLAEQVRADGAQFTLLVFPFRLQVEPGAPPPTAQQRIGRFCEEQAIDFLDALPWLAPLGAPGFVDYDHLSKEGAEAVARNLIGVAAAAPD